MISDQGTSGQSCRRGVFSSPCSSGEAPVDPRVPGTRAQADNALHFLPKEKSFWGHHPHGGHPAARGPHPSVAPGCFRFSFTTLFKSQPPCHAPACGPLGAQPLLLGHAARRHCPGAHVLQSGLPVGLSSHSVARAPCITSHSPSVHLMDADGPQAQKLPVENGSTWGPESLLGSELPLLITWMRNNFRWD